MEFEKYRSFCMGTAGQSLGGSARCIRQSTSRQRSHSVRLLQRDDASVSTNQTICLGEAQQSPVSGLRSKAPITRNRTVGMLLPLSAATAALTRLNNCGMENSPIEHSGFHHPRISLLPLGRRLRKYNEWYSLIQSRHCDTGTGVSWIGKEYRSRCKQAASRRRNTPLGFRGALPHTTNLR